MSSPKLQVLEVATRRHDRGRTKLEGLPAAVPEAGLVRSSGRRALQQQRRTSTPSSAASSRRPAKASTVAAGVVLGHLGDGGRCILLVRGGGRINDGRGKAERHGQEQQQRPSRSGPARRSTSFAPRNAAAPPSTWPATWLPASYRRRRARLLLWSQLLFLKKFRDPIAFFRKLIGT